MVCVLLCVCGSRQLLYRFLLPQRFVFIARVRCFVYVVFITFIVHSTKCLSLITFVDYETIILSPRRLENYRPLHMFIMYQYWSFANITQIRMLVQQYAEMQITSDAMISVALVSVVPNEEIHRRVRVLFPHSRWSRYKLTIENGERCCSCMFYFTSTEYYELFFFPARQLLFCNALSYYQPARTLCRLLISETSLLHTPGHLFSTTRIFFLFTTDECTLISAALLLRVLRRLQGVTSYMCNIEVLISGEVTQLFRVKWCLTCFPKM